MNKRFKIKAKEIASALGVSPATVSLALNDKPGVNADTKKRILDYIGTMESGGDSALYGGTVMLLVYSAPGTPKWPENRHLFNTDYMEFTRMAQRAHMELKLQYAYTPQELREILEQIPDHILGVILNGDEIPEECLSILDRCPVPLVAYSCMLAGRDWDVINFHNAKAVREGVALLEQAGYRDVVYLMNTFPIHNFTTRRQEYRRCMERPLMIPTGENLESMADAAYRYLKERSSLPDAVFSENYMVTIGLAMAVQRLGLQVPRDFAVIAIDAIPDTVTIPFDLAHFQVAHATRSRILGERLLQKMRSKQRQPATEILVAMDYIPGGSMGQAAL